MRSSVRHPLTPWQCPRCELWHDEFRCPACPPAQPMGILQALKQIEKSEKRNRRRR
jgi:hypothetical protein